MYSKRSLFSILNKDRKEIDYIKLIYKRRVQAEIDSYKVTEDKNKKEIINTQVVLIIDKVSL